MDYDNGVILAGEVFNDSALYDAEIRKIVPNYDFMLDLVTEMVPPSAMEIMELGCGSGELTMKLLKKCQFATVTCIDYSEKMLSLLSKKIPSDFMKRLRLVKLDFADDLPDGPKYDACISSLSIHHLSDVNKQTLFEKIFQKLNNSGGLWIADAMLAESDYFQNIYRKSRLIWSERNGIDLCLIDKCNRAFSISESSPHDQKATLESQLQMLRAVGYSDVAVLWKHYDLAVFGALK